MNTDTRKPYEERASETREQKPVSPSFILGILSLVLLVVSPQIISLILGIIGLEKGARDRRPDSPYSRGEAGWIMSLIGVVLSSLIIFLALVVIIGMLILLSY